MYVMLGTIARNILKRRAATMYVSHFLIKDT